jgi:hypothetical protein
MPAKLALAATASPPLAAERADLETAVRKLLAAEEAVPKLERATTEASDAVITAVSAVAAARAAVSKAGTVDADALAEAVLAGQPVASLTSGREARTALADAEDVLAQATQIRDALSTKTQEAKATLSLAETWARSAALAVVQATNAASLAAFIGETAQMQEQLQGRLAALAWLRAQRLVPHIDPTISRIVSFRLSVDPGVPRPLDPTSTAGKWERVVTALMRDPKAPASLA